MTNWMTQLAVLAPTIILTAGALVILLLDVIFDRIKTGLLGYLGAVFSLISFCTVAFYMMGYRGEYFSGTLLIDGLALFSGNIFLIATFLVLMMSVGYVERLEDHGEYYALVLLAAVGMLTMTWTTHLVVIFIGLEILSIASYVLTGYFRNVRNSSEASLKYFLTGAFSSGILLYGIAIVYGYTGSLDLNKISDFLIHNQGPFVYIGTAAVLSGFLFKIAAFPFHSWSPDVYEGAPTPVTAFMSVGTKAAAFVVLLRLTFVSFQEFEFYIAGVLGVVSVLTMTVGNIAALVQDSLKRMLAYSSIAHAGYILIGVVAGSYYGGAGVLFYLLAYAFMNIGAFCVVLTAERKTGKEIFIQNLKGAASSQPFIGLSMSVFMFSLAGIPPFSGFFGKFYVFSSAIKSAGNELDRFFVILVIIAVINTLISVYYYLRVLVYMFMKSERGRDMRLNIPSFGQYFVIALSMIVTVILGIFSSGVLKLTNDIIKGML